jgi:hypothetical protein
LADFSKIGSLAIVSINQRRILNHEGKIDKGLLGDKINKNLLSNSELKFSKFFGKSWAVDDVEDVILSSVESTEENNSFKIKRIYSNVTPVIDY